METNFKGTKGEWRVHTYGVWARTPNTITHVANHPQDNITSVDEKKYNANLIAESGNVRQQIPFSLTELLERYKELIMKPEIYKGWAIKKSDYASKYYEATNLNDCDAYMKHSTSVKQIKNEIDDETI